MPAATAVDLENFATLVVPILKERGLFQRVHRTSTLRERLGLRFPGEILADGRSAQVPFPPNCGGGTIL